MNLLYARYGKEVMEQKIKELFGEDMHESGKQGGEINFQEFLSSVEAVQYDLFTKSNLGRKLNKEKVMKD